MMFTSYEEFLNWKEVYEKESLSWFVKSTGKKVLQNTKVTYFNCNRSGFFTSESSGIRNTKMQGSSKIDAHCTASIQCHHLEKGTVQIKVFKTHYGHQCSLGHIRISENDRMMIAKLVSQGVNFDFILDKVRDSVGQKIERLHLVTKKDLHNIERSFGIRREQRHSVDAVSVKIWVNEMRERQDNPVLFYKEQGKSEATIGTNIGLNPDDFALVIQTPLQAELLKLCGNGKVVCADATHGTNSYNFQLISVLVIDEFGEGFPAGWCISNKEDHTLLTNFFAHLRMRTGPINPEWFMSDMAEQYFSSWVSAFGGNPKKLICTWHVDRAWRKNLPRILDKDLQTEVYHMLRVLLEELDSEQFHQLLQNITKKLTENDFTADFGEYFIQHYSQHPQEWAGCYRKHACINTNMYAESFHRVIKYVYLKGKVNKRMDFCITVLLRYARDKAFDRLLKLEKGKSTKRNSAILQRHRLSLTLPTSLVTSQGNYQWDVQSSTKKNITYTVEKIEEGCKGECWIRCQACSVCIHSFTCTCPDSLLHGVICKHIHLVIRSSGELQLRPVKNCLKPQSCNTTMLSSIQNKSRLKAQDSVKDKLCMKLSKIAASITDVDDLDTLLSIEKHLNSCTSLIKLCQYGKNVEPANKTITKQRNFFSTRRKKTSKVRIAKPSLSEKYKIINSFLQAIPCTSMASVPKSDIEILSTICIHTSLEKLADHNSVVDVDGIINSAEELPVSVLDISDDELQNLQKYFTPRAHLMICQEVKRKQLSWQCMKCYSSTSSQNLIACDQCECWYHWACAGIEEEPVEEVWHCTTCTQQELPS